MSKQVKGLIVNDIRRRLTGINDALLLNVIGLDSGKTFQLRKRLREKNINLLVVKSSLARKATEGTSLAPAFNQADGSLALCWGSEDFVSLVKEVVAVKKLAEFEKLEAKSGVLDGDHLSAAKLLDVAKWPNRQEQLSILLGQILSPGARLLSQLTSPGGLLASQIKKKSEGELGASEASDAQ